jgi:hypothetical protein
MNEAERLKDLDVSMQLQTIQFHRQTDSAATPDARQMAAAMADGLEQVLDLAYVATVGLLAACCGTGPLAAYGRVCDAIGGGGAYRGPEAGAAVASPPRGRYSAHASEAEGLPTWRTPVRYRFWSGAGSRSA